MELKSKGQTAMEYMLILVVVVALIVAIMFWLQSTSSDIRDVTQGNSGNYLCATTKCTDHAQCANTPECPTTATCNPNTGFCEN